ncbi:MAG: SDR family NAD(P)-dependent oxidoreductase [Cyclobacteriaceae bacterium]
MILNHSNSETKAKQTADTIIQNGGTDIVIKADVSQRNGVTHLFDKTIDAFGKVDVLINNTVSSAAKKVLCCL